VSALVALTALSACDTGDGKQLKDFDPADYPSQTTVPPTIEGEFAVDQTSDVELPGSVDPATTDAAGGTAEPFSLIAPWVTGGDIDALHTCDGPDVSPALSWGGVPAGTAEIAIVMVDDSAVSDGQPFVHWVIAGLDPGEVALVEGDVPAGALQGLNFFGDVGYGGPCPPPGDGPHLYRTTAYALNQQLELADGDVATEFLATIATVSIASTDVTGFYQR
jgi:Raf kinase inhibitor-like YbhB/YbcL family protein